MIRQNNKKLNKKPNKKLNKKPNHLFLLFLLSGDFPSIGAAEIKILAKRKIKPLDSTLLAFDCPEQPLKQPDFLHRLAYTKTVFKLAFYCQASKLQGNIKKFGWLSIYKKNFCARKILLSSAKSRQAMISEKELAGPIWHGLEAKGIKPKVKLNGSSTEITFIFYKNKVACGVKIWENKEDFQSRRPHLRPGFSPVSLQPKFARAMVNLTGIRGSSRPNEKTLYDPFCGTGGILIEAGLMGIKSKGSDINESMYWKCLKNINHFGLSEKCSVKRKDAKTITEKMDFIATDLPYGRSSVPRCERALLNIYKGFAKTLDKQWTGKGRAVICFSDNIDFLKFLRAVNKKKDIKKMHEFRIKVHNSLNRRLVVLDRKDKTITELSCKKCRKLSHI